MSARGVPVRTHPPAVLAIGGSDPSAGAGIQADLRTLEAFGVVPLTAVTAITAQDGQRVRAVAPVAPKLLAAQIDAALDVLPAAVVKCGMLARPALVEVVARVVAARGLELVVDPVLRASGGERLGDRRLLAALAGRLVPLAAVVTPNLDEAAALAGISVSSVDAMVEAGRRIHALGARAVVVTGGHLDGAPVDVIVTGGSVVRLRGARIGRDMHGTGCAFASALAAGLARGDSLRPSVAGARAHVRALLRNALRTASDARLRAPRRTRR